MMMMRSALVIWLSAVRLIQDILPEFKRCRAAFLIYVWKCSQIPVTDKIIPPLSSSKTLFVNAFKTISNLDIFAPCCFGSLRRHFYLFVPVSASQHRCSTRALLTLASLSSHPLLRSLRHAPALAWFSALPCESCQLYTTIFRWTKSAPGGSIGPHSPTA